LDIVQILKILKIFFRIIKKIKKKKNTFREVCTKVGIVNFINSRVLLAGLKDQPVTRGMKNTPPLAAVENIGQ